MNIVQLSGRLTRDPDLRFVGSTDFPICTLNLAVDDGDSRWNRETQKREVGSGFYRVEVPGDYGRFVWEHTQKGDEIYVIGSLSQFQMTKRDSNEKESKTQVRATFVKIITARVGPVRQAIQAPEVPLTDEEPAPGWEDEPF